MRFICVQRLRFGKISRKTTVTASTKVALWLRTAKNTSLFAPEVKRLKAIVASEQMNNMLGWGSVQPPLDIVYCQNESGQNPMRP